MAQEIERRWLVRGYTYPVGGVDVSVGIEQGYLERPNPQHSLRVRIMDDARAVITFKDGIGMVRDEREEPIPVPAARILMQTCEHRVGKLRSEFRGGWELDEFLEPLHGIVLLEYEGDDEAEVRAAVPPPWITEAVEVTDSLTNLHLARMATDLQGTDRSPLMVLTAQLGKHVRRIVITGGPGSGKSSMLALLQAWYPDLHFVPEVATIVIGQVGIRPTGVSARRFQDTILRVQRIFEATSSEFALAAGKRALVMDRGTMDSAAYMPGGLADLERMFGTSAEAEYAQYDLVIVLAMPPREIYERIKADNPSRSENYEQALDRGIRIHHAWSRHPNYHEVTNDGGWDGKVAAVRRLLDGFLG